MKYWDSSAIVPLLVTEAVSTSLMRLYKSDPIILAWWGTKVECTSALCRLERQKDLTAAETSNAIKLLNSLSDEWHSIEPTDNLRELSIRLLRVHNLAAADSLQLAAAIIAKETHVGKMEFVCQDERLVQAASKEGLNVVVQT